VPVGSTKSGAVFVQLSFLILEQMNLRTVTAGTSYHLELSRYAHNCDALRSNFAEIFSRVGSGRGDVVVEGM